MPRIVIDARELRTSTGRYIERLIHYLQQTDKENEYIILLKPEDFAGWQPAAANFRKVKSPYKEFTFSEQFGLVWQLYRLKADLAHFGMTQQPLLYFKRSVTTIHDLTTLRFRNPSTNAVVFSIKQAVYSVVVRYAAHKSKAVIVPSQFVKDDLVDYTQCSPDKITITYESADKISDIAVAVDSVQGRDFIMYVGRPFPHKNLWRLIKAFELIQKDRPNLHLVLAGKLSSNYTDIAKRVEKDKINNVVFTDFVSEGQLRWLYENCQAYVFPSLSEGFGLPGLEAMKHGAPIVSSNATCLPEIYGDAAHYFDPLDVEDIAEKISEVLDQPALRDELIKKGTEQVKKYSWRRMAEQTLEVYRKVLGESKQ